MPQDPLSPELRNFIAGSIRSVGHLEALLLLWRNREHAWTPEQVSNEMRSNSSYALQQLQELADRGLLTQVGREEFKFGPALTDWATLVEQLAILYRERRNSVIGAIYEPPLDKIRDFADAFKIKKGDDDG